MEGHIHSIESFGTVDGPGIRLVVFLKGCPMRCLYCHNPDTWSMQGSKTMDADAIISLFNKNRPFYKNGGITVTGGEPLLQAEFVTELFEKARMENIHTCLDTSGIIFDKTDTAVVRKIDALLDFCDLVMLDIKAIDEEKHKKLTGHSNRNVLDFAHHLENREIPVWIRHVVVPGITDDEADLLELGRFIGSLKNAKALDVLPYHTMGVKKYQELGIEYPLKDVPAATKAQAVSAREQILIGIKASKK